MKKIYWNATRLNEEIAKIEKAGYQLPTTIYRVQSGLTRVVIQNGLKRAGYIRSYEESISFQQRKFGEDFRGYSIEEYNEDLKRLQDELGRERSYQGEVIEQRKRLFDIVSDMNSELEKDIDVSKWTTKDLYDAVKEAATKVKDTKSTSPMFYEYLADILEKGSSKV